MDPTAQREQRGASSREPSIERLFRERYEDMLRLALVLSEDRQTAEDVVQDAFIGLAKHWDSLRDREAASGYLARSVVNGCRSQDRRRGQRARLRDRNASVRLDASVSSEEAMLVASDVELVGAAMSRLPPVQRVVVMSRYQLGMSRMEVADMLGISLNSVKTHLSRGLKRLATDLEGMR